MTTRSRNNTEDRSVILDALRYFHKPGETIEICALGPMTGKSSLWEGFAGGSKGTVAGWFNDMEKAAAVAAELNRVGAEGIYHTLNPCNDALLSRANNRLKAGVARTQDKEILSLRWLLVDIDPQRVAGVSSSDVEHARAIERAMEVKESLSSRGWPDPLVGDSGNGAHLVYRIPELANIPENVELLKGVLKALSGLFQGHKGDTLLEIDQKVFNPARISKLYGTMARKGDHSEARPHRPSMILDRPGVAIPLTLKQLEELAVISGKAEETPVKSRAYSESPPMSRISDSRLDVIAYLDRYGVPVKKVKENGESKLYVLDWCLFDASHSGGEAAICQGGDGKLFYQCFHDSCRGRTWGEARKIISGEDKLTPFISGLRPRTFSSRKAQSPPKQNPENGTGKASEQPSEEQDAAADARARISALNEKHAILMLGGKCVVMNERVDPVFQRPDLTFTPIPDFRHFYSNERHWVSYGESGRKQVDIGRLWLESPERRQYEGIIFCPGLDVPGYFNMYRGLAIKPKPGDWSLFSDHIFSVICNGNQDVYNYVIAWLAHLFQCPGKERPGTAIVLRGRMGTGKGCFASQIGAILGSHYLHIAHQRQLTGNFNNHLKDALFVFVDEGIWAGDKQAEGALKAMISESQLAIEPKGKDVFMVHNFIRLLIATNNDWAIPAGLEERRFLVLDVNEGRIQDHKYFAELVEQMDNGGREAMLHDLLQLEISGFNLREAPKTMALFDQIVHSMTVAQKFWFETLWNGSLRLEDDGWIEDGVPYADVFRAYVAMSERMKEYRPHIHTTLIKELKKLCPGIFTVRRRDENSKLVNYLIVPTLEECRKSLEARVGMSIDWDSSNVQKKQVVI